jgi:hypothetical protein
MTTMLRAHCAALAIGLLLVLAAGSVAAQNPAVAPPLRDPKACSDAQQLLPKGPARQPSEPSNQTLSDKLERSEGVVCPPTGVDPEIAIPPPGGGRTPVIPPPGSPGGDPTVRPK